MTDSFHILIVDDHQDIVENLERKLQEKYADSIIKTCTDCDSAFTYIKQQLYNQPVSLLIQDLSFTHYPKNAYLKEGIDLLAALKAQKISVNIIVYTSHSTIFHIHPTMKEYAPQGYVIKQHNSSNTLLFAADRVLSGGTYFDNEVVEQLYKRTSYEKQLDGIDKAIIEHLPYVNDKGKRLDWDGAIIKPDGKPMSYNSINIRIEKLLHKFEVDTQAQLLLKLQRSGLLR